MINVSGAFHTPYMKDVEAGKVLDDDDHDAVDQGLLQRCKVYTSVDEMKSLLKRQLLEPVKWEQGTKDLIAGGYAQYVEPGPASSSRR